MRISVIIPTRNRDHYLAEAVESVLQQDIPDFELIVVNDGATSPILTDKRITIINSGQKGAVPARNLGLETASGDIIAWLDDDDRWSAKDHLSNAVNILQSQNALYFADGVMKFPDEAAPRSFAKDATAQSLQHDNTILISAVCYRRALHQSLGMFDENLPYYWDWDWYLRVAKAGHNLHRRQSPVVDIRIHQANMSGDANTRERQNNLDLLSRKHDLGKIALKNHADFATR